MYRAVVVVTFDVPRPKVAKDLASNSKGIGGQAVECIEGATEILGRARIVFQIEDGAFAVEDFSKNQMILTAGQSADDVINCFACLGGTAQHCQASSQPVLKAEFRVKSEHLV